jgi:CO/xanthine dehydrogenase FAD-binding subunit
MGTMGGSVANNDPAACYPSAVLALGATVQTNKRKIAADDFFQGMFTTALEEGELITAIHFPLAKKSAYAKFRQPASRFALVGVFVAQTEQGVRVAITGAGNGVFRHAGLEALPGRVEMAKRPIRDSAERIEHALSGLDALQRQRLSEVFQANAERRALCKGGIALASTLAKLRFNKEANTNRPYNC